MSKLVRIDEDCEKILRTYDDGSISDCIRTMHEKIGTSLPDHTQHPLPDIEAVLRKVLAEGVNLSPKEKIAFQNLNRTLVEAMSEHNKI